MKPADLLDAKRFLAGRVDEAGGPDESPRSPGPWPSRLALAATLTPFAVAVVVLLVVVGDDYHPWVDYAWIEMRTRDLGRHPVDVGLWSRGDWFHPGPAQFYVFALPYRMVGGASVGIPLAAVLVNGAAVAGMAVVARRLGGLPAMVATLLGCGLLLRALGPEFARDAWNPTVTVLPFGLTVFLAWAMTCGRVWALPAGAAVASFAAQAHIGNALLALPLVAWGAAWLAALALRTRRPRERPPVTTVSGRSLARAAVVTGVILAVMWAPPVAQELRNDRGNVTAIRHYFETSGDMTHSLADGLRVVATPFGVPPEWVAGPGPTTITREPASLYRPPVPWLLGLFALAALVVVRRGPPAARRLLLTLGVAAALGVISVARTLGQIWAYRLLWSQVLAMVAGVLAMWTCWVVVAPRLTGRGARIAGAGRARAAALAGVVALAAVNTVAAAGAGVPDSEQPIPGPETPSAALAALAPAVEAALPAGDGPVLLTPTSPGSWMYVFGLLLSLERAGVDARLTPDYIQVGDHRHHHGGPVRAEIVLATNGDIALVDDDPALTPIAQWGRVPPPPAPDDPTALAERLWDAGPAEQEQLQHLARATAERSHQLRKPWTVHALAAFVRHP